MPTSPEQSEAMRREFRARIQPLVDLKASIVGVALPRFMLDGRVGSLVSTELNPEVQGLLDDCDAEIQKVADEYLVNL